MTLQALEMLIWISRMYLMIIGWISFKIIFWTIDKTLLDKCMGYPYVHYR